MLKQSMYAIYLESWGYNEAIHQVFKLPNHHQECQEAQGHHPYMMPEKNSLALSHIYISSI